MGTEWNDRVQWSGSVCLPMVLWELLFVVIDPEEVQHLVAGACCDVSFEDCNISLPQHMHQICTTTLVRCSALKRGKATQTIPLSRNPRHLQQTNKACCTKTWSIKKKSPSHREVVLSCAHCCVHTTIPCRIDDRNDKGAIYALQKQNCCRTE